MGSSQWNLNIKKTYKTEQKYFASAIFLGYWNKLSADVHLTVHLDGTLLFMVFQKAKKWGPARLLHEEHSQCFTHCITMTWYVWLTMAYLWLGFFWGGWSSIHIMPNNILELSMIDVKSLILSAANKNKSRSPLPNPWAIETPFEISCLLTVLLNFSEKYRM